MLLFSRISDRIYKIFAGYPAAGYPAKSVQPYLFLLTGNRISVRWMPGRISGHEWVTCWSWWWRTSSHAAGRPAFPAYHQSWGIGSGYFDWIQMLWSYSHQSVLVVYPDLVILVGFISGFFGRYWMRLLKRSKLDPVQTLKPDTEIKSL